MRIAQLCQCGRIKQDTCECSTQKAASKTDYRRSPSERGYDRQWRELSERFRRANPLCQRCLQVDRTTPAMDVHHIVPISQRIDLRLDWDNLMSVCRKCHKILDSFND